MEAMVVFSAGLVVYCSYCVAVDALQDLRRERRGNLPETAFERAKTAAQESAAVACVVGKEKLARILAARARRVNKIPAQGYSARRQGAL